MLTKNDVKKELDLANVAPVLTVRDASRILDKKRITIYSLIAKGLLVKAGAGVISRESLENLMLSQPKYFTALFAKNHPASMEA